MELIEIPNEMPDFLLSVRTDDGRVYVFAWDRTSSVYYGHRPVVLMRKITTPLYDHIAYFRHKRSSRRTLQDRLKEWAKPIIRADKSRILLDALGEL